jgi:D-glycero-D-manno-heptose 1,7-bisphosphate phosphatase
MNRQRPGLVILDRDGVINEDSDDYIKSADEWLALPGSLDAIARLNHAGIPVAVATNQSGIGRGLYTIEALNEIHAKLVRALSRIGGHIEGIFFCPHLPDSGCECRKPAPGLLYQASRRFNVPLDGVPFVGDKRIDVLAAQSCGAQPMLVRTGKGMRTHNEFPDLHDLPWFDDLSEAVDFILIDGRSA